MCDKPQGQKQLQGFAQTIYHLAYGCKYVGEQSYKDYADKLINVFFIDPETRMDPSVKFAQSKPGQAPDGNELFVVAVSTFKRGATVPGPIPSSDESPQSCVIHVRRPAGLDGLARMGTVRAVSLAETAQTITQDRAGLVDHAVLR